jgi:vacuolar-type H+-ATPase subunit I/STV1
VTDSHKVEEMLLLYVQEALDLRHSDADDPEGALTPVDPTEGHQAVMHMLLRVRQRSDRSDFILARVTQLRARVRRARDEAKFEADLRYDQATDENARTRVKEYSTRDERHAAAALEALEEKRAAHLADRLVSVADEAYEVVKQIDFQFGSIRNELRAMLHALQFESTLER